MLPLKHVGLKYLVIFIALVTHFSSFANDSKLDEEFAKSLAAQKLNMNIAAQTRDKVLRQWAGQKERTYRGQVFTRRNFDPDVATGKPCLVSFRVEFDRYVSHSNIIVSKSDIFGRWFDEVVFNLYPRLYNEQTRTISPYDIGLASIYVLDFNIDTLQPVSAFVSTGANTQFTPWIDSVVTSCRNLSLIHSE